MGIGTRPAHAPVNIIHLLQRSEEPFAIARAANLWEGWRVICARGVPARTCCNDGYTDLVWVALPMWQTEFGRSYVGVGWLRTVYSGPWQASRSPATVSMPPRCLPPAPPWPRYQLWIRASRLVLALLLGGIGAATQRSIASASALVTRTFSLARSLRMFGTYNFAGDVGKDWYQSILTPHLPPKAQPTRPDTGLDRFLLDTEGLYLIYLALPWGT